MDNISLSAEVVEDKCMKYKGNGEGENDSDAFIANEPVLAKLITNETDSILSRFEVIIGTR